jgi:DnaK suppressor protein
MARKGTKLTQKKIVDIKKNLLNIKEKLTMTSKESEFFHIDKNELSDSLDEANVNIQANQLLRFRNRELFYLKKINLALARIENGEFGKCQECEEDISFERLKARPTAELCISCKEEAEMCENGQIRKSSSIGKSMNETARFRA